MSAPWTIDALDQAPDPMGAMWRRISHADSAATRGQLVLGAFRDPADGLVFTGTAPESNVLWLGPPRVNKSSGGLGPEIVLHLGLTFVITTKPDLPQQLAIACTRKGPVSHLDLTGTHTYPGMYQKRWNFMAGATSFTAAKRIGLSVSKAAASPGARDHAFWQKLGADYIAPVIWAVNLAGKHKTADGYQFCLDVVSGDESASDEMESILDDLGGRDGQVALRKWRSFDRIHAEGVGSVRLTVMHALGALERPEVRNASADANLDLDDLLVQNTGQDINFHVVEDEQVRRFASMGIAARDGWPAVGVSPTIFVTVEDDDEEAGVLARIFVHELWHAVKERHKNDQEAGVTNRPKVLLAWDELATGFPDPEYPKIVAQCADRGLIISAAMHDLGQAAAIWPEAESFLNVHRHIMAFPDIRHTGTLQALSTVIGNRWHDVEQRNWGRNADGQAHSGGGQGPQRLPILDPGEIRAGKPGDPKAALGIFPEGWAYIWPTPMWAARPWPRALITSMAYVARLAEVPGWEFLGALPVPELDRCDRDGVPYLVSTQRNGAALLSQYRHYKARFADMRGDYAPTERT